MELTIGGPQVRQREVFRDERNHEKGSPASGCFNAPGRELRTFSARKALMEPRRVIRNWTC